ncbi:hypothetical protein V6N12_019471 [Hibiscus sabdariffa]|uniref:RNase L inhibitor RLI-like possible metal-binding domain-containing protein n=1 Tax=Hibiscus sabdariffa TaxID=183260 RepID=A0ABR2BMB4_9ROSI
MADRLTRIAVVSSDRCKPKKCRQECKKSCPVDKTGKLCVEVSAASKIASISEELCIGCGICVKIINLPRDLDKDTTHRYGPNSFKLHSSITENEIEIFPACCQAIRQFLYSSSLVNGRKIRQVWMQLKRQSAKRVGEFL